MSQEEEGEIAGAVGIGKREMKDGESSGTTKEGVLWKTRISWVSFSSNNLYGRFPIECRQTYKLVPGSLNCRNVAKECE